MSDEKWWGGCIQGCFPRMSMGLHTVCQAFLDALGELCAFSLRGGFAQHLYISSRPIRNLKLSLPQTDWEALPFRINDSLSSNKSKEKTIAGAYRLKKNKQISINHHLQILSRESIFQEKKDVRLLETWTLTEHLSFRSSLFLVFESDSDIIFLYSHSLSEIHIEILWTKGWIFVKIMGDRHLGMNVRRWIMNCQ